MVALQPNPINVAAGTGAHLATQINVGGIAVIALRHRQLAVGRRFKFHRNARRRQWMTAGGTKENCSCF